jgi:hypothetical protein
MQLVTLGVAPHNVANVIKLGASYVGVDFEKRLRKVGADKIVEYPIPSTSTCAALPDRMAVLVQVHLGCELGARQQHLAAEKKDTVFDFAIRTTSRA